MSGSARSVYVSRLRRAFLLRVHPDRFSKSAAVTRRQQAALVQALENRLAEADFVQWQTTAAVVTARTAGCSSSTRTQSLSAQEQQQQQVFPFVLEKRDGTLLKASLQLGGAGANVDSILDSMALALQRSGAASLPVPPPPQQQEQSSSCLKETHGFQYPRKNGGPMHYATTTTTFNSSIDHQYDVHSQAGRCLATFLESRPMAQEIQIRRRHRTDAQAVAWQVRRLFQWQAVDATPLQWSSQSVAVLLRRLVDLHAEYSNHNNKNKNNKLRDSYYPLRLQFSTREPWPDEPENAALDVHAGILRLHPAHTTVQWLETLQTVTDENWNRVIAQRRRFQQHQHQVQHALPVWLQKGFTCSSRQYHACLEQWADQLTMIASTGTAAAAATPDSIFLPAPEPVTVVVEDDAACRRRRCRVGEVVVTGIGGAHIRVGHGLSAAELQHAVQQWHESVRTAAFRQAEAATHSHTAVQAAQWQLGLHKVYRARTPRVIPHEQWTASLQRLLATAAAVEQWKSHLTGNSLGFAAAGQFCHLADDGSMVIPHDWT